jgi:hypothetical protein
MTRRKVKFGKRRLRAENQESGFRKCPWSEQ